MQRPNQKDHLKVVLTHERKRLELTQEDVAEAVGASLRNYQRWERGLTFPQAFYLEQLRTYFGACIDEIVVQPSPDSANSENSENSEQPSEKTASRVHWSVINRHDSTYHRHFMVLLAILAVAVCLGFVLHIKYPSGLGQVKPGGAWISPVGPVVGDVLHFSAYAYPTNKDDPAIDHVNFTAYWQGIDPRQWVIACVARVPVRTDVYACDANLQLLGASPGQIIISFDVYDRQGNANLSPNGKHRFVYVAGQ